MLRAIADDCDLTKTTLQHIKSVLSGIFTHAKNEGAYDGENPVEGANSPERSRTGRDLRLQPGPDSAHFEVLPLLPKAAVATASFAGLREGELRGVEWPDFAGDTLTVKRSIWKAVVNEPKTRASRQSVPVIPTLAKILDDYRASMHNPGTGVIFHSGNGEPMDMDKLAQRVSVRQSRPAACRGMAGTVSGAALRPTCTSWVPMTKSFSACCVTPSRM